MGILDFSSTAIGWVDGNIDRYKYRNATTPRSAFPPRYSFNMFSVSSVAGRMLSVMSFPFSLSGVRFILSLRTSSSDRLQLNLRTYQNIVNNTA